MRTEAYTDQGTSHMEGRILLLATLRNWMTTTICGETLMILAWVLGFCLQNTGRRIGMPFGDRGCSFFFFFGYE